MKVEETKLKMSPLQTYLTARALDEPIKQFYKCPENEEKFQEWLKSQKGGVNGKVNDDDGGSPGGNRTAEKQSLREDSEEG